MGTAITGDRPRARIGETARAFLNPQTLTSLGPLIALLLACLYFNIRTDGRFLTGPNLSIIAQQSMVVAILAIGQTLVILTAGIDLSNGAVMAFGTIVAARLAVISGVEPTLAMLLGVGACAAFGALNGTLITRIRLPPFIVTLGTLNIAYALTFIYSDVQTTRVSGALVWLGSTFKVGDTVVTYSTVLMFALYFLTWFVLSQSAVGRHVYALGNNPEAARLTGINTSRLLVTVYTVAGVFYGIAGLVLVARQRVGDPQAGQTENLDSITAVVLGGTSLFGGRGGVVGTLMGALIVGVFRSGLQQTGVDPIYQRLITGVLVILAVAVDQLARRKQ